MPSLEVVHQPAEHRFVVRVDDQVVGQTVYLRRGIDNVFVHTEVDPAFGGRGIASELISRALAITRADGNRIVAICPFVKKYLTQNHEFDDIVDAPAPHLTPRTQGTGSGPASE